MWHASARAKAISFRNTESLENVFLQVENTAGTAAQLLNNTQKTLNHHKIGNEGHYKQKLIKPFHKKLLNMILK